jgi:hypothetical protein
MNVRNMEISHFKIKISISRLLKLKITGMKYSRIDLTPNFKNLIQMKNLNQYDDSLLDEDYESDINDIDQIYIENLYFELWKELTWDIDIVVNGVWCKEDKPELSQEQWNNYENLLAATSEILTPKQLVAIYFFSSNEAKNTKCPHERKQLIIQKMAISNNLRDYDISDFQDFCYKIDKIRQSEFIELTDNLYNSKVIKTLCDKPDIQTAKFEKKWSNF